jgi:pimeloyl-ACP methyl ester carboxylesterase
VQLGEVRTWYDERGSGEPLVLLHGGMGDASNFLANVDALAERFHVYLPERRGHGHTPDVDGPITYAAMAADTVAFLETIVGGAAHLVGYSDGAIVGLLIAKDRPDLVARMVCISGNFHFDGLVPDTSGIDEAHLPPSAAKVARMWTQEPSMTTAELGNIRARTLVMAADDDAVTLEHTIAMYRAIPDSELAIVPGTSHLLIGEKPALCNRLILDFLVDAAPATFLPIRRAQGDR